MNNIALNIIDDSNMEYYKFHSFQTLMWDEGDSDMDFLEYWIQEEDIDEDKMTSYQSQFTPLFGTGDGGNYCLWNYEGLEGDAPVVFFGSDGQYEMVAASLSDYAHLLASGKTCDVESSFNGIWEKDLSSYYIDDVQEEFELGTYEEAEALVLKDLNDFKSEVELKLGESKSVEFYLNNITKHLNFKTFIESIDNTK